MSFKSKLFSFFPVLHLILISLSIYCFVVGASLLSYASIFFSIYLFPLISFRLLNLFFPIIEGESDILSRKFSPWWAGHQIQLLFIAVPQLESILIMIPGMYSLWLRCWGSQIGKKVYWTPGVVNYDRNLLEIGDGVVFGERSLTVAHVITPKDGKGILKILKVRIGKKAFVGAGSVLSPGVVMDEKTFVKAGSNVFPETHITQNGYTGKIVAVDD